MPSSTHAITAHGLEIPVVIALSAGEMLKRVGRGIVLPRPERATGLLDTGTDATAVSAALLQRLNITASRQTSTVTFGGSIGVNIFEISLSVVQPGWAGGPAFAVPDLEVMDFAQSLQHFDAIIGLDVIRKVQLLIDGPGGQFTLTW